MNIDVFDSMKKEKKDEKKMRIKKGLEAKQRGMKWNCI